MMTMTMEGKGRSKKILKRKRRTQKKVFGNGGKIPQIQSD